MKKTLIVNLFGGPGAGKTAAAWEIAAGLKKQDFDVEYVPEYAKELVYAENFTLLTNQAHVTGEQQRRLEVLRGKVDIVVTDSPVILGKVYGNANSEDFNRQISEWHNSFPTFNLFIKRGRGDYNQAGRIENFEQAKQKDVEIKNLLETEKVFYGTYNRNSAELIIDNICMTYNKLNNITKKEPAITKKPGALKKKTVSKRQLQLG